MNTFRPLLAAFVVLVLTAACSDAGPLLPHDSTPATAPPATRTVESTEDLDADAESTEDIRCCWKNEDGTWSCSRRTIRCTLGIVEVTAALGRVSQRTSEDRGATGDTVVDTPGTIVGGTAGTFTDESGRRCWIDLKTGQKRCRL